MTNKIFLFTLFALCIHTFVYAQSSTAAQLSSDSGKIEFFKQAQSEYPDYTYACRILSQQVKENPTDAELSYFLGYSLDRSNSNDGKSMYLINKELTLQASEQFEKVNALQPKYLGEKVVLDPYSKLSAIWGSLAMAYLNRAQQDSAIWAFKQGKSRGGFLEPILQFNRHILQQCDKNSILITSGDNITITIWYLQTIEHFRTDVTVIDVSLLNTSWYPKYLKNAKKVNINLLDDEIDSLSYIHWETKELKIVDPKKSQKDLIWTLPPTYLNEYILVGDQLLLDIIKNNFFTHAIYFTLESDSSYNLHLGNHLKDRGLVQQIIQDTTAKNLDYKNLLTAIKSFNLNEIEKETIIHSDDALSMLNFYRYVYYKNANILYEQHQLRDAKALMDLMDVNFPINKLPYESSAQEQGYHEFQQYLNSQVE